MDIVLVAGLWLQQSIWDETSALLRERDYRGVPVSLPGQDDDNTGAILSDQIDAVINEIDNAPGAPVVVGHSAACSLAWLAADARPYKVGKVVLVGGFPHAEGESYADFFDYEEGLMPFPGWDQFDDRDTADLDHAARRAMEESMTAVPKGVTQAVMRYTDVRRYSIPVAVVCPEFSVTEAQEVIDSGDVYEIANTTRVTLHDIDSGHWPMISKPGAFTEALIEAAEA